MTNEELKEEIQKVESKLEKFICNDFHHLDQKFDKILYLIIATLASSVTALITLFLKTLQ
jgi:hypothetical protein